MWTPQKQEPVATCVIQTLENKTHEISTCTL